MRPILYIPTFNSLDYNEQSYTGYGLTAAMLGPRLQYSNCLGFANFFYYPELKNFDGYFAIFSYPIAHTAFDVTLKRALFANNGENLFTESNLLSLGYTLPFISRQQGKNDVYLCGLAYAAGELARISMEPLSLTSNAEKVFGAYGGAGLEFTISKTLPRNCSQTFDFVLMGTSFWTNAGSNPDIKFGAETELSYQLDKRDIKYELSVKGRYSPFPATICPPNSGVKYGGKELDCSMPIRIVPRAALIFPDIFMKTLDTKVYCEMLASANPDNLNNISFDKSVMTGLELGEYSNHMEAAIGTSLRLDFADEDITQEAFNFYLRLKLSWYRL